MVSTSFNVHAEPMVCTVDDALRAFFHSELDHLYLEGRLISRVDNSKCPPTFRRRARSARRIIPARPAASRLQEAELRQLRSNFEWADSQRQAWRKVAEEKEAALIERDRILNEHDKIQHHVADDYQQLLQRCRELQQTVAAMESSVFWRAALRFRRMFPQESRRGRILRKIKRTVS